MVTDQGPKGGGWRWVKVHGLMIGAWVVHVLGWLLPVVKDGVALPKGVPGWEAFRVGFSDVWPYYQVHSETWYSALLSIVSALSSLVFLLSLWVVLQPSERALRLLSWLAVVGFVVNAVWAFPSDLELRAGYFLWWLSFLLLAVGANMVRRLGIEPRTY